MKRIALLSTLIMPLFTSFGMEVQRRHPVKLPNVVNSCFINASLQALFSMERLSELLVDYKAIYKPGSFAEAYTKLAQQSLAQKDISSDDLESFCFLGWNLIGKGIQTQEDAGEFVQKALQHISDNDINDEMYQSFPRHATGQPLTEFSELYTIKLSSQIKDPLFKGGFEGVKKEEPSVMLTLPLNNANTLKEAVESFFAPEQVTYSLYGSPLPEPFKVTRLEGLGKYVVIHLKRTGFSVTLEKPIKNTQPVSFPLSKLNFQPYFSEEAKSPGRYDLLAFVIHGGSSTGGHYTAYARYGNQWFSCNDNIIKPVDLSIIKRIAKVGYDQYKERVPTTFVYQLTTDQQRAEESLQIKSRTTPSKSEKKESVITTQRYIQEPIQTSRPVQRTTPTVTYPQRATQEPSYTQEPEEGIMQQMMSYYYSQVAQEGYKSSQKK